MSGIEFVALSIVAFVVIRMLSGFGLAALIYFAALLTAFYHYLRWSAGL